jgi:hypothetical protein
VSKARCGQKRGALSAASWSCSQCRRLGRSERPVEICRSAPRRRSPASPRLDTKSSSIGQSFSAVRFATVPAIAVARSEERQTAWCASPSPTTGRRIRTPAWRHLLHRRRLLASLSFAALAGELFARDLAVPSAIHRPTSQEPEGKTNGRPPGRLGRRNHRCAPPWQRRSTPAVDMLSNSTRR